MNVHERAIVILLLLVALLGQVTQASAQTQGADSPFMEEGSTIFIGAPDTSAFPTIQFQLDAYNAQGLFINNLRPRDLSVVENGASIQPDSMKIVQNGLQVIIALNTGPALAKETNGVSEYQRVQTALLEWAGEQELAQQTTGEAAADDYSLSTPAGLFLIRERQPDQLIKALTDYQPDLQQTPTSLNSLVEAMDLATNPSVTPSIKRSILLITPAVEGDNSAVITALTNRAREIGVRVNVWLMTPTVQPVPPPAGENPPASLQTLAETTGGEFLQITPADPLPEIEKHFEPQRKTYQVQYTSAINTSGVHALSVNLVKGSEKLTSLQQSFDLAVQPPNPIFLSPPTSVERTWLPAEKGQEPVLTPDVVSIQILVEFPDQHPRGLIATRLYVDGQMVAENTAPPFEDFAWPVAELSTTAPHALRVEAVDILGLSGSSIEIPVDILVKQPAKAGLFDQLSERGMVAIAAIAVSGLALGLVLVLTSSQRWSRGKNQRVDKKRMKDPVTQPVVIRQEQSRPKKGKGAAPVSTPVSRPNWPPAIWQSASWPRAHAAQNAPARLVILDENEQPITGGMLPLTRQEVTFGSDPRRATQVLDSPTIDSLHARLFRNEDGRFYLVDQNSIAGTWINYAPVSTNGCALEHGDLIHIGKVLFRFELTDPAKVSAAEITVTPLDKIL